MNEPVKQPDPQARLKDALLALQRMRARLESVEQAQHEPIAVIGLGCRFPGGVTSPAAFWDLLRNGVDAIRDIPADRWDVDAFYDPDPDAPGKTYTRRGGFLEQVDQFDAHFFGISPREARNMDPQQRLLLEVAWESLENAGHAPDQLAGTRTGVFVGITGNDYLQLQASPGDYTHINPYRLTGNALHAAAGRLSYVLGFQGPCMAIDTACSSSAVSVHLACQSLRLRESDLALAGGVNLILSPEWTITLSKNRMLSPDDSCKTFDSRANGYVRGEGCGLLVLKRLSDAWADKDNVLAVIRGSAINQDGTTSGFTVPNKLAQERVIRAALENARVAPHEVNYVEAHGTGTSLGDPIEVRALGAVLGQDRPSDAPFVLGSVKTNLGHTESAAGVAGLTKVVLSLQHEAIPPHLHFLEPNPYVAWQEIPVEIPTRLRPWPRGSQARIAGVSSFGGSGINAHLVVAEAPPRRPEPEKPERPFGLLTLSARDERGLGALVKRYEQHLAAAPEASLADVCFTANVGRSHLAHRTAIVAGSVAQLQTKLAAWADEPRPSGVAVGKAAGQDRPKVAFLFTGQGSQYAHMGRQLYETQRVFREALDRCDELLRPWLERSLLSVIYADDDETAGLLDQTAYTQPALFALEYALAELWRSWGIEPAIMMGHSVGEYVAACVAGVFSLEDGLKLVAERARLMQALPPTGTMAAVFADEAQVTAACAPYADQVSIAAVNGPTNIVISGDVQAVDAILQKLGDDGIRSRRLSVSHAFHSPLIEPMLDAFEQAARQVSWHAPRIPLVSNVTGQLMAPGTVPDAAYWRRHTRQAVQFAAAIETMHNQGLEIFLEIGPSPTLLAMGRRCVPGEAGLWLPSLRQGRDDWQPLLESLGALYVRGAAVDWAAVDQDYAARRLPLPTYPFERQRYWIDPPPRRALAPARAASDSHPLVGERLRSAGREIVFETQLGTDSVPFLADHRVHGVVVLPATAYVEMALAAAREILGPGAHAVEDLVFHQALVLEEDKARTVQLVLTPEGSSGAAMRVYSLEAEDQANGADSWSLHVSGRIRLAVGDDTAPVSVSLAELQQRCPVVTSANAHYDQLRARGLLFGSAFRGIEQIWHQEGEALGEVRLPESLASQVGPFQVHPALLDACLQVVAVLLPAGEEGSTTYLPSSLDHLAVYGPLGARVWSHVVIGASRGQQPDMLTGDVRVFDEGGQLIAEVKGLAFRRARREALTAAPAKGADDWLYEVVWKSQPQEADSVAAALLSPTQVAERLQPWLDRLSRQESTLSFANLIPHLNALSTTHILYALQQLGWTFSLGQRVSAAGLAEKLGVIEPHHRLLRRLLQILHEAGFLAQQGDEWEVCQIPDMADPETQLASLLERYPTARVELNMTARIGRCFAAALCGDCDPLELLFPEGSLTEAEEFYQKSSFSHGHNVLIQRAMVTALEQVPTNKKIRILEVGAGTGGTTAHVLPELRSHQVDYVFTDVSAVFTNRARKKFQDYPFVRYQVLDIERDPEAQGFAPQQFDLILASNVLHATSDLGQTLANVQKLLAAEGMLVLLEGTGPQAFVDILVGLTEGWWKFSDSALRPSYPLISPAQWLDLLLGMGFSEVASVLGETVLTHQAVLLARAGGGPESGQAPTPAGTQDPWLILADAGGLGAKLAERLRARGQPTVMVYPGPAFEAVGPAHFQLDPARPEDLRRLVTSVLAGDQAACQGIIDLWPLDQATRAAKTLTTAQLAEAQVKVCGGVMHLIQALAAAEGNKLPGLWLVTRGAQPAGPVGGLPQSGLVQATLWGLGRVIAQEHPEMNCVCLDLDPAGTAGDVDTLLRALQAGDGEGLVAIRQGQRFVPRLVRSTIDSQSDRQPPSLASQPVRLDSSERGILENLELRPLTRRPPGPGQVEIRVQATGLGFKDVLNALDMYPGDTRFFGSECAGEVVAVGENVDGLSVGDQVVAVAPGSFASFVTVQADLVALKPEHLSLVEAATIPSAFLTAYYTLHRLAGMAAGDRVLIHAAAGGVGMAAVQLAQAAGAEIYATAGSPEKRALLKSLGVQHVMDSRSLDFAQEIQAATGGAGVDIVLNSLTGEFIPKGLSVLAQNGRFVEIGKRGIWTPAQVADVRPDVAYYTVDLMAEALKNSDLIASMFGALWPAFSLGTLRPLPVRVFPMENVIDAFRTMAQAKHMGKIVVTQEHEPGQPSLPAIHPHATYLVTGGLGGLGLAVARWLVEQGARHLVLVGRKAPSPSAREVVADLERAGAAVVVAQADVSRAEELGQVVAQIEQSAAPLRGVIHAAGVLDDGVLLQQDWKRFARVLEPKVEGGWNLHLLTRHIPLDFFVLFSSAVSLLGSAGQANHVAASTFLDMLAHHRRAEGLAALSIDWGPWSAVGAAAERNVGARMLGRGIDSMTPEQGIASFERVMGWSDPESGRRFTQVGVISMNWPVFLQPMTAAGLPRFFAELVDELPAPPAQPATQAAPAEEMPDVLRRFAEAAPARRLSILLAYVRGQVIRVLDLDPSFQLDQRQPLQELGLDSLMAVELRNLLGVGLGLKRALSATLVFDYPTVEALAGYLAPLLVSELRLVDEQARPPATTPVPAPAGSEPGTWADLEQMSDEEAEKLLLAELDAPRRND